MNKIFANHEVEYFSGYDRIASHESIISIEKRMGLPDRIQYHFKKDEVAAYFGIRWNVAEAEAWLNSPTIEKSSDRARIKLFWKV